MMNTTVNGNDEILTRLHETIAAGDLNLILEGLVDLEKKVLADDSMAKLVTEPPVITKLYNDLETAGVPRRAMLLRNRVPGRNRRAFLFVKAMQNGVKRALNVG